MINLKNSGKNYTIFSSQFLIGHFFYSKLLINKKVSNNRVQIVVELSMEIFLGDFGDFFCDNFVVKVHNIP